MRLRSMMSRFYTPRPRTTRGENIRTRAPDSARREGSASPAMGMRAPYNHFEILQTHMGVDLGGF